MEIKNLYAPFEIAVLEADSYAVQIRRNTFFEMVFILEGKGIQIINDHQLPYAADKLFLIFPQDTHGFEVHEATRFFFLRFNDSYLQTQRQEWIQQLEFIFHNHNHLPGCILRNVSDKPFIRALAEALIREESQEHPHRQEVIRQLINTTITLAARNMTYMAGGDLKPGASEEHIYLLNYIHRHIYNPEALKAEQIATHFNRSPTYISAYFKQKTGEGLQQYLTGYKLKLIETRLRFTNMQVNEIVFEFGFTDASHLNRLFRKYKGMSPSEYRKSFVL